MFPCSPMFPYVPQGPLPSMFPMFPPLQGGNMEGNIDGEHRPGICRGTMEEALT